MNKTTSDISAKRSLFRYDHPSGKNNNVILTQFRNNYRLTASKDGADKRFATL